MFSFMDTFAVFIRKIYHEKDIKTIVFIAVCAMLLTGTSVFADMILPFSGFYMFLRSIILIALSGSLSCVFYLAAIRGHYWMSERKDWKPLRVRFSHQWRIRMSILATAPILVMIYVTNHSPYYTFVNSLITCLIISLILFTRPTKDERRREQFGLPDARDLEHNLALANAISERAERKKSKKKTDDK